MAPYQIERERDTENILPSGYLSSLFQTAFLTTASCRGTQAISHAAVPDAMVCFALLTIPDMLLHACGAKHAPGARRRARRLASSSLQTLAASDASPPATRYYVCPRQRGLSPCTVPDVTLMHARAGTGNAVRAQAAPQLHYDGWSSFKRLTACDPPLVAKSGRPMKLALTPEVRRL